MANSSAVWLEVEVEDGEETYLVGIDSLEGFQIVDEATVNGVEEIDLEADWCWGMTDLPYGTYDFSRFGEFGETVITRYEVKDRVMGDLDNRITIRWVEKSEWVIEPEEHEKARYIDGDWMTARLEGVDGNDREAYWGLRS